MKFLRICNKCNEFFERPREKKYMYVCEECRIKSRENMFKRKLLTPVITEIPYNPI